MPTQGLGRSAADAGWREGHDHESAWRLDDLDLRCHDAHRWARRRIDRPSSSRTSCGSVQVPGIAHSRSAAVRSVDRCPRPSPLRLPTHLRRRGQPDPDRTTSRNRCRACQIRDRFRRRPRPAAGRASGHRLPSPWQGCAGDHHPPGARHGLRTAREGDVRLPGFAPDDQGRRRVGGRTRRRVPVSGAEPDGRERGAPLRGLRPPWSARRAVPDGRDHRLVAHAAARSRFGLDEDPGLDRRCRRSSWQRWLRSRAHC